jgi:hypothetical protein
MFRVPHFNVYKQNPIFQFELRRVKRLATPARLRLYSALVQAIPSIITLGLYFVALNDYVFHFFQNNSSAGYYYSSSFNDGLGAGFLFIMALTGLMLMCGDIYYMAVTVHSINNQINSGHWELVRLTPMDAADIFEAKLTTAHIRAWRVMNVEVALRLMAITLVSAMILFPERAYTSGQSLVGRSSIWGGLLDSLQERPYYTILILITFFSWLIAYVLEPRWRMRSITSLGMVISSRIHNISLSSVAGFFSIFGFHLLQVVLFFAVGWFFVQTFASMDYAYSSYNYDFRFILTLVVMLAMLGLLFLFYRISERWARQTAIHFAFRPDR